MATEQPTTIPVPKSNKVFICQYCSQPFTRPRPQKYCSHVCRARANVDQLAKNLPPPKDPEQRFWDTVIKTDECWEWQGKKFPNNYGCFFVTEDGKKRWKLAHRVAWKLRDGTLDDELLILHTCDNPICVRNDDQGWYEVNGVLRRRYGHLFEGTTQDNIDDKVYKQRQGAAHGTASARAKFTDEQVREIRRLNKEGLGKRKIAALYGVGQTTIHAIVRNLTWRHLL